MSDNSIEYHVGEGRRHGPVTTGCDNVIAWRLGEAFSKAEAALSGDYIDRGLALILALNEKGFQVVVPARLQTAPGAALERKRDE